MEEFTDANIGLSDIYGPAAVSRLEDMLGEANDGFERARVIQRFLLSRTRRDTPDSLVHHAVWRLSHDPNCSVRHLASKLDISERQLSRRFHTMVGTSVKRFARVVRLGKAVAARRQGANWTDIAHACGYTDQAHLIHDFKLMAGCPPDGLLKAISVAKYLDLNAALAVSGFSNTFIV
jgi:AraC-like DNA-binding protein